MTSNQRAKLSAEANSLDALVQVGKDGVDDAVIKQVLDAFNTRELLKVKVLLSSAPDEPKAVSEALSKGTGSEVIRVIGGVIILFKINPELRKKAADRKKREADKRRREAEERRAAAAAKRARYQRQQH